MKILITGDTHEGTTMPEILDGFYQDMAKEKPDMVLHTGDWGTCDLHDVDVGMERYRKWLPDTFTLTVWGNHDYWQTGGSISYKGIGHLRYELYNISTVRYTIEHVNDSPDLQEPSINIYGFDGWYAHEDPPTNDIKFMPRDYGDMPMHKQMFNIAKDQLYYILDHLERSPKPRLLMTHFPFANNPFSAPARWMEFVAPYFDYVVFGHSHRPADYMVGKCRVINAGSDINNPRYTVLEV